MKPFLCFLSLSLKHLCCFCLIFCFLQFLLFIKKKKVPKRYLIVPFLFFLAYNVLISWAPLYKSNCTHFLCVSDGNPAWHLTVILSPFCFVHQQLLEHFWISASLSVLLMMFEAKRNTTYSSGNMIYWLCRVDNSKMLV